MSTDYPIDDYDPGPTREELFDRLRDPDRADAARNEILTMYYPFMYGAVQRISIPRQYHEQVISDVVESLARYLKRFRYNKKSGRFRGYVKRCLKNAWLKTRPHEKTHEQFGFDPEFLDAAAPMGSLLDHTLEDEMRSDEVLRAVEKALAALNSKHADIARSVLLNGRACAEVAKEFGVSMDNLYQIVSRARVAIKEILDQMDDWPDHGRA
jgi:RNA polymerase sigma factor (sigma-70 family)